MGKQTTLLQKSEPPLIRQASRSLKHKLRFLLLQRRTHIVPCFPSSKPILDWPAKKAFSPLFTAWSAAAGRRDKQSGEGERSQCQQAMLEVPLLSSRSLPPSASLSHMTFRRDISTIAAASQRASDLWPPRCRDHGEEERRGEGERRRKQKRRGIERRGGE